MPTGNVARAGLMTSASLDPPEPWSPLVAIHGIEPPAPPDPPDPPDPPGPWPDGLVEAYAERWLPLTRLGYLLTGSRAVAEELVQDVFLKARAGWDRIDQPNAYLRASLVNATRDWGRRAQVADRHRPTTVDHAVDHPDEMWDALSRLDHRRRSAIVLRFYDDLPEAEIAGLLDCRPNTVRTLIHRGLRDLRREMTTTTPTEPGTDAGLSSAPGGDDSMEARLRRVLHDRAATVDGPRAELYDDLVTPLPLALARSSRHRLSTRTRVVGAVAAGLVLASAFGVTQWNQPGRPAQRLDASGSTTRSSEPRSVVSACVAPSKIDSSLAGNDGSVTILDVTCSDTLRLDLQGAYRGADPDHPVPFGDTREGAVRSYLAGVLGEDAMSDVEVGPYVGDGAEQVAHVPVTFATGQVVPFYVEEYDGGGWNVLPEPVGHSGPGAWHAPGLAEDAASSLTLPVVPGAVTARLWYRSGADTLTVDLGADVLTRIASGAVPGIEVVVPGQVEGMVTVFLDADGRPVTVDAISGVGSAVPTGGPLIEGSDTAGGN
jgi:RNA polymerase sigma factor (sigma-70 family)